MTGFYHMCIRAISELRIYPVLMGIGVGAQVLKEQQVSDKMHTLGEAVQNGSLSTSPDCQI